MSLSDYIVNIIALTFLVVFFVIEVLNKMYMKLFVIFDFGLCTALCVVKQLSLLKIEE